MLPWLAAKESAEEREAGEAAEHWETRTKAAS